MEFIEALKQGKAEVEEFTNEEQRRLAELDEVFIELNKQVRSFTENKIAIKRSTDRLWLIAYNPKAHLPVYYKIAKWQESGKVYPCFITLKNTAATKLTGADGLQIYPDNILCCYNQSDVEAALQQLLKNTDVVKLLLNIERGCVVKYSLFPD